MALIPTVPGLAVRPVDNSEEMMAARRLHAQCYLDAGYISDADLSSDRIIHDDWVAFSDYFVAVDTDADEIVGTCRIIRPSVRGFPCFQHFALREDAQSIFRTMDPNRCSEISALATPRNGLQNMAISAALYGMVWRESIRNSRAYMLAIVDDRLLRIMRRWFEFPFEAIGEPTFYMGARTTPVAMYIPRTVEHLRSVNPDALAYFSGEISFSELENVSLDIRQQVPEHSTNVIDLLVEASPLP